MNKIGNKMPLLSTLAALVIIVHSAEENYESDYRDFRPRILDTAPASYEQAWRGSETEHFQLAEKNEPDTWQNIHADESERRRRPGRKRNRRPQLSSTEDILPTYTRLDESMPIQDEGSHYNSEIPKRRRKKIDSHLESDINRPTRWNNDELKGSQRRRNGQRRKRPLIDSWPQNEETSRHHQNTETEKEINEDKTLSHLIRHDEETEVNKDVTNTKFIEATFPPSIARKKIRNKLNNENNFKPEVLVDKLINIENQKPSANEINKPKTGSSDQNKRPDPTTIKELLKKSKGKSLIEILQQNNLSLSDLLNGNEQAVSILKSRDFEQSEELQNTKSTVTNKIKDIQKASFEDSLNKSENDNLFNDNNKPINFIDNISVKEPQNIEEKALDQSETINKSKLNDSSKIIDFSTRSKIRRRYPVVRRKLRMRPIISNSYKAQLSRDLISLSSIKQQNNENSSNLRDMKPVKQDEEQIEDRIVDITNDGSLETTTYLPEELATTVDDERSELTTVLMLNEENDANENGETLNTADSKIPIISQTECENKETTTLMFELDPDQFIAVTTTEFPKEYFSSRPSGTMRRQNFETRLKRKRQKQRQRLSTESSEDLVSKDIFNIPNLVPASEFITQTKTTKANDELDLTTLEDFITTETPFDNRQRNKSRKRNFNRKPTPKAISSTEITAKIEIQEILNDTSTSERLSRILKERNMTFNELLEQRERGSSYVHLADIFHNASKEPNPPEPFLSKSLIEPISKETYPLRALLEANQHDPKIDAITEQSNYLNKPIVLDFGSNVNENSENMGIISLFQNFSKHNKLAEEIKPINNKTEEGLKEQNQIMTDAKLNEKEKTEGRGLEVDKALITWNEIINLMHDKEQNMTNEIVSNIEIKNIEDNKLEKTKLNDEPAEERFGIYDDLQYLTKQLKNEIVSPSNNDIYEEPENPEVIDTIDSTYSTTKSVTVATACIIGLSLILFLLTYTILKWKQDAKVYKNKSMKHNDIPTPVFENRKGLKINSSTRSKSPMLATSNIYSIDSLETHKGNDSPEYMWDTLRKPFQ